MTKVFIDGREGTTGLRIYDRLSAREDLELIVLPEAERKNPEKRREAINKSDISFLCLPDAAAIEAAQMAENPKTVLLDTSTAHRTDPDWAYGFPELSAAHLEAVRKSNRIAVPGCHAGGFIALVYPLVKCGILPRSALLTSYSVTGYSGGGKSMIAEYEAEERSYQFDSPRQYGLSQMHKHLPEMQHVTGITQPPVFMPIVCDFYSGMATCIPLHTNLFQKKVTKAELVAMLQDYYKGHPLISVEDTDVGFLAANEIRNTNKLKLYIEGNDERMTLISVFDNLGKGASGAAVQNMNLVLGLPETTGLI